MAVREIKFHKTETTESNERNGSHDSATFCRAYPRIQGLFKIQGSLEGDRHLFHGALTGGSFISVMFSLILLLLFNYQPLYPTHIFTLCCIFCLLIIWLLYIHLF